MRNFSVNIRLLIVSIIVIIGFFITELFFTETKVRSYSHKMEEAVELAKKWFDVVKVQKEIRSIETDAISNIPYRHLLGDDFTFLTTTIGTLNAKEISANPDFAALIVRWIQEANIKTDDKVGIIISGSFPSLAISTLAAMQTLGFEIVLMSSLGASSFGANQPGATWIDIEKWLVEYGNMKYQSEIVSIGAENDNGLGLTNEGMELIMEAVERTGINLFVPENLPNSINHRVEVFLEHNIALLINVGGNQAALGRCPHSSSIPNGFNETIRLCNHNERGVIQEINSKGIPVINLLNIKDLANNYGMDISPGIRYAESLKLFHKKKTNKAALSIALIISLVFISQLKSNKNI